MKRLVVLSLNPSVDRFINCDIELNSLNVVKEYTDIPAGKGINVAKILRNLQNDVLLLGILGNDNKDIFLKYFEKYNIHNQIVLSDGETRINLKIVSETQVKSAFFHDHTPVILQSQRGSTTEINFKNRFDLTSLEQLLEVLPNLEEKYFIITGGLPINFNDDVYFRIIKYLKIKGCFVALDASELPLKLAIRAQPDIIKPNINELEGLLNKKLLNDQEVIEEARNLIIKHNLGTVIVSQGKKGALFIKKDKALKAELKISNKDLNFSKDLEKKGFFYKFNEEVGNTRTLQIVNATGAGDSMVAGFMSGIMENKSFEECSTLAAACSLSTLLQSGVGVNKNYLPEFCSKIKIKEI
ncbi:1-phosphofructokinase [Candidatus Hepatincolaceae symbiont of Richtersius coronifer]